MAITLRLTKGSPLTHQELDDNFSELEGLITGINAATGSFLYSGSFDGSSTLTLYSGDTNYSIDLSALSGGGGSADLTSLNAFTGSIQIEVDNLTAATSSYLTADDTGSFLFSGSYDSSTGTITLYSIDGNYDLDLSDLAGGSTDISALNTFTGSIQTEVDNLTAATSSYLTAADTGSFYYSSSAELNTITFFQGDGTTESVTIDTGSGGGGVGTYSNSTPTPIDFPNGDDPSIAAGTTFVSKSFQEMMDLMLYPELNPTLTAPSSTFTISPSGFREIGETIATVTLSATFSRGSISPAYGTSGFRSGLPNTYNYGGYGATDNSSTSLTDSETISNHVVELGANSWSGSVSYDAGDQPLTSKGNNYSSPLSAGDTSEITRTITGVYPVFATTSAIGTLTKQSLQSMTTYIQVSMVAETATNVTDGDRQEIHIPNAWSTITGIQQYNTLSGQWDSIALSSFTTSATTKTIHSNSVNYTKYTYNGAQVGARQLRFIV